MREYRDEGVDDDSLRDSYAYEYFIRARPDARI